MSEVITDLSGATINIRKIIQEELERIWNSGGAGRKALSETELNIKVKDILIVKVEDVISTSIENTVPVTITNQPTVNIGDQNIIDIGNEPIIHLKDTIPTDRIWSLSKNTDNILVFAGETLPLELLESTTMALTDTYQTVLSKDVNNFPEVKIITIRNTSANSLKYTLYGTEVESPGVNDWITLIGNGGAIEEQTLAGNKNTYEYSDLPWRFLRIDCKNSVGGETATVKIQLRSALKRI